MDFKANIETRESVEAKAKAAFGFDLSKGRRDCLSFVPLRSPARSTAAGSALKYQGAGVCISPFTTDR